MTKPQVKICGITDPEALAAAAGADYLGFVFAEKSPRFVTPAAARVLAQAVRPGQGRVGLFVNPSDGELSAVLEEVPIDYIQLHGAESPARVAHVAKAFGLPVIKALGLETRADLATLQGYLPVADMLLLDAKPPRGEEDGLPGGNARAFDWKILEGLQIKKPWFLAGGLTASSLQEAQKLSGASCFDVSSGVERARGIKDPEKIRAFIAAVRALEVV